MADYFLVTMARGRAWDYSRPRRSQDRWEEHAAFMDALVEDGLIVLGGPVGEGDGEEVLHVVNAENEATIRTRLAEDPWADDLLSVRSVQPWNVWLRAPGRPQ
jgi:uncharacterized protein YciI